MNRIIYLTALWAFFALPPIVLCIRAFRPKLMPWWFAAVLVAVLGWFLVNAAVHFYYAHLDDLLRPYAECNHAPADLLALRCADGAKMIFALLFGWAYGLVYSVPWILVYGLMQAVCCIARRCRSAKADRM
ncbi:MAG: hypothetical protein NTZ46_04930 [Verrucomicrobia bacterium]|nr:hypothetical protein [Verrucomicrobiota bacterium]